MIVERFELCEFHSAKASAKASNQLAKSRWKTKHLKTFELAENLLVGNGFGIRTNKKVTAL